MDSIMKNLSAEEKEAIEELQLRLNSLLTPEMSNDSKFFYRFLKARDFNVNKAEEMIKNHITWRKAFQVHTILEWFEPTELYKYIGMHRIGQDKKGNPVLYAASGKIDVKDFVKVIKMNDYMKYWIWLAEKDIDLHKCNNNADDVKWVTIFNLDGLPLHCVLHKASIDFLLRCNHLFQDNYPERLKGIYVINTPTYFTVLFSIMKKVMSSALLNKYHIYGQNGWKEALLDIIDADVLPAFLGGKRTDPDGDPLCKSFIYHGGKIPSKYYISEKERYFKDKSRVETVVIPNNEKHRIRVDISEVGSLIQWEFISKDIDIGFGLELQLHDNTPEELLPIQKIVTSDGTEEGFFKTQRTGTYFIVFDNSGSWWSSKEVHYCITIKPASFPVRD